MQMPTDSNKQAIQPGTVASLAMIKTRKIEQVTARRELDVYSIGDDIPLSAYSTAHFWRWYEQGKIAINGYMWDWRTDWRTACKADLIEIHDDLFDDVAPRKIKPLRRKVGSELVRLGRVICP